MIKLMKFQDSESNKCRWSELAERLIGDWFVVWEDAYVDYQGSAELLAYKDGAFCYLEWSYGSCSGCDPWEDIPENEALCEMKRNAMFFTDAAYLYTWISMLSKTGDRKAGIFTQVLFDLGQLLKK